MSSLNNPPKRQDEDNPASNVEEDDWTLAGQSQPPTDNPYPMNVPSGDDMQYDQHSILTQSVAPSPPQSHPVTDTFEVIGGILEILSSIAELFQ